MYRIRQTKRKTPLGVSAPLHVGTMHALLLIVTDHQSESIHIIQGFLTWVFFPIITSRGIAFIGSAFPWCGAIAVFAMPCPVYPSRAVHWPALLDGPRGPVLGACARLSCLDHICSKHNLRVIPYCAFLALIAANFLLRRFLLASSKASVSIILSHHRKLDA